MRGIGKVHSEVSASSIQWYYVSEENGDVHSQKKTCLYWLVIRDEGISKENQKEDRKNCDCFAWYDDFFELGGYVYNDLIKKAISYDYAILIGGIDDKVIRLSTQDEKYSPRDNIYLEYGMFSGILSTNRILFIIHEDCRVASDLAGMTLKRYCDEETALNISEEWIANAIVGHKTQEFTAQDIEMLPTVGISVGYFYNFLLPFLKVLSTTNKYLLNDTEYLIRSKKLVVSVPEYLESEEDAIEQYRAALMDDGYLVESFVGKFRILVDADALEEGTLLVHDIPSTLLSVFKTVDYIFGIRAGAGTEDSKNAKYRALDNFSDNLIRLMEGHTRLSKYVEFRRLKG